MIKKKPDFLVIVLLVFGLGVLSTGFASVAKSLKEQPELNAQTISPQSLTDANLVSGVTRH